MFIKDKEISSMLKEADFEADGVVSYKEFIKMMEGEIAPSVGLREETSKIVKLNTLAENAEDSDIDGMLFYKLCNGFFILSCVV